MSPTFHNGMTAANNATGARPRRYLSAPPSPASTLLSSTNAPRRAGASRWKVAMRTPV
jgi:hypothetical protein